MGLTLKSYRPSPTHSNVVTFRNCFWSLTWLESVLCLWLSCTKWSNQWTMNDAKTKNVWIIFRQLITKKDLANLRWRAQGPIVTHEKSKVKTFFITYIYLCNKNPINTVWLFVHISYLRDLKRIIRKWKGFKTKRHNKMIYRRKIWVKHR